MAGWVLPAIIMGASLAKAAYDEKKEKKEKKEAARDYALETVYSPWLGNKPQKREHFRADPFGTLLQGGVAAAATYQQGKNTEAVKDLKKGSPEWEASRAAGLKGIDAGNLYGPEEASSMWIKEQVPEELNQYMTQQSWDNMNPYERRSLIRLYQNMYAKKGY